MKQQKQEGITVFISYMPDDRAVHDRLVKHLSQLQRDGLVKAWSDQQIAPGSDRTQAIDQAFRSAQIVLLLISADFLASDAKYQIEMQQALERHRQGEARVIPIIVRPCDWQFSSFAHLQCLPRNRKPITTWKNQDEAFVSIAEELRKTIIQQQFSPPLLTKKQRQNRAQLIKRGVPFLVEDLPDDFVPRPHEFEALISKLLDKQRGEPVAITAALRGAGGYGKTTLARALCHDPRIQEAFDDGILWVTLGEHPGNLVGKVEDLIYMLNKERPGFTGIDAAEARLVELLAERDILLVVDDVWDAMHLKPFLQGGKRCARLVTTRNENVLPTNAHSQVVDAMQSDEAVQLLSFGLQTGAFTVTEILALRALVARLGEWPLLLKLANGVLSDRVRRGEALINALVYLNRALDRHGLTAFDAGNTQARNMAVSATLRASFDLLHAEQYARYCELAVFPEDVDIPLATLQKLWGATGGLDDFDTEELCLTLYQHSLLLNFDLATRMIRLHDVIRSYLQKAVGDALPALHVQLLDAYALKYWADLPGDEAYLWDHLADHLVAAGRLEELAATVKDLRYLANKTLARSAYATEADLAFAERRMPADLSLRLLNRNFVNIGHLLNRCITFSETASVLHSRLAPLKELSDLCQAFKQEIPRPFLACWHPLPDLPHPALMRTLSGHMNQVRECAISPQGDYIVSASLDKTLKVWDARTGEERRTLSGHTDSVYGCAISPSGDYIVSASVDKTLKMWDACTGEEQRTLSGHRSVVAGCAISPQGDYMG